MAMRETARSLRAYFILAGILSLGGSVTTLQSQQSTGLDGIRALLGLAFGAGFLIAGIRLPRMLEGGALFVRVLICTIVGVQLLLGALLLLAGAQPVTLVFPALYVAICAYLVTNVNRLVREGRSGPPPGAAALGPAPHGPAARSRLLPLACCCSCSAPSGRSCSRARPSRPTRPARRTCWPTSPASRRWPGSAACSSAGCATAAGSARRSRPDQRGSSGIGAPSHCAGGAMPRSAAAVGATSSARTRGRRAPLGTPRPSATKMPCMSRWRTGS